MTSCAKPIADFILPSNEPEAPAEVRFKNNSKKSETYEWDFGDGKSSTEESPSHTYNSSGNYLYAKAYH